MATRYSYLEMLRARNAPATTLSQAVDSCPPRCSHVPFVELRSLIAKLPDDSRTSRACLRDKRPGTAAWLSTMSQSVPRPTTAIPFAHTVCRSYTEHFASEFTMQRSMGDTIGPTKHKWGNKLNVTGNHVSVQRASASIQPAPCCC
jgi:hypothetical protein